jgi:hypothetical protein
LNERAGENSDSGNIFELVFTFGNIAQAQWVDAADIDRDGDLDYAYCAREADRVGWLENINNTKFENHIISQGLDGPHALKIVDLNGDEWPDIAIAAADGGVIAWWENPQEPFVTSTVRSILFDYTNARWIESADFDNDNDNDLVVCASDLGVVDWLENTNGDGTTWNRRSIESSNLGVNAVDVGHFNNDLFVDVVASSSVTDTIILYENPTTTGTIWNAVPIASSFEGAISVETNDWDNNGDIDVIATAIIDNKVSIFNNDDGVGQSWSEIPVGSLEGVAHAQSGDINGDGRMDIIAAGFGANEIVIYQNEDNTTFTELGSILSTTQPRYISLHDIDNDGDDDLAVASFGTQEVNIWNNKFFETSLETSATGLTEFFNGQQLPILELELSHTDGSSSVTPDIIGPVEIKELAFLFEESTGDPLSQAEALGIIGDLQLFRDSGTSPSLPTFDPAIDMEVATDFSFFTGLTSEGVLTININTNEPLAEVDAGTSATFFLVQTSPTTIPETAPDQYQVTHLASCSTSPTIEGFTRIVDLNTTNTVVLEPVQNVSTGIIQVKRDQPIIPAAPTDAGEFSTTTTVVFQWLPAQFKSRNFPIESYEIGIGPIPGSSSFFLGDVGNVLEYAYEGQHGQTLFAKVRATDSRGVTGAFSAPSDGIFIDTFAPVTTSPTTPLEYVNIPEITYTWAEADDGPLSSGIVNYHLRVINAFPPPLYDFEGDLGTATSFTFDNVVESGWYSARVQATDAAGNTGELSAPSILVQVDTVAPQSQLDALSSPTVVASSVINLAYTASDAASGVESVILHYRKVGDAGYQQLLDTDGTSPVRFDLGVAGGFGDYEFFTQATDRAGNQEALKTVPDATASIQPQGNDIILAY